LRTPGCMPWSEKHMMLKLWKYKQNWMDINWSTVKTFLHYSNHALTHCKVQLDYDKNYSKTVLRTWFDCSIKKPCTDRIKNLTQLNPVFRGHMVILHSPKWGPYSELVQQTLVCSDFKKQKKKHSQHCYSSIPGFSTFCPTPFPHYNWWWQLLALCIICCQ